MPRYTLPDASVREYDEPVSAHQVASDIGPGLAKAAIGARVDGQITDLHATLTRDCDLAIITPTTRDKQLDPDALYLMRHSAAHVMAEAIERLFPGVLFVYGPPVENGFYYDIALPEGRSLSSDDFEKIEREIEAISKEARPFTRVELDTRAGMSKLEGENNKYKIDNAQRAIEAGSDTLSWYVTGTPGEHWEDLCRGPHVPTTKHIGAVKVMSVASSYWHGDADSDSLTRVYGTSFPSKKDLDAYLHQLEEAKKRDHRVVGRKHDLFVIDDMVGQGLILWTPKGSIIRNELQTFISEELRRQGYQTVYTPHVAKLELFKTSGHFPYYQDSQYPPMVERDALHEMAQEGCSCAELANRLKDGDIDGYMLKPMNCPMHIRVFDSSPRSYRDLPIRLAEFGTVYRWEQSGELNGMTRVRGFTQDDAHLFCTEEQVADEVRGCLSIVKLIFGTLGMTDYNVRVGLRDPDSSKYVGASEHWDKAERACIDAVKEMGVEYSEDPGEAAFYGPKIDFIVKDVIGRAWQLGTVQVDYNLPERFDLSYIGADNAPHRPVMIHRAPFGSMERFIGVLIEHFAGAFPAWLSPEQVRVLPISEKTNDYAEGVLARLRARNIRATVDNSNERVQAKIKQAAEEKIPYMLVVGPRDAQGDAVSVRARGIQKDLGSIPTEQFVDALHDEIVSRGESSVVASWERLSV
ncbi:MAG: threonine--tRNA ligase [Phycisphaerales bacterium JB043]